MTGSTSGVQASGSLPRPVVAPIAVRGDELQRVLVLVHHQAVVAELDDKLLRSIRAGVTTVLPELAQLGRSLWRRRAEILAYFDIGASNGPVEAINGRLEYLRGTALGFRKLGHYILRSLIHTVGLQARINAL